MRQGGPDGTTEAVHEGTRGRSGAAGADQRPDTADDLGVGLSTLTRWLGRARDRQRPARDGAAEADLAAELKRLRRENEVLRQERDILKRATAFFAREGSR